MWEASVALIFLDCVLFFILICFVHRFIPPKQQQKQIRARDRNRWKNKKGKTHDESTFNNLAIIGKTSVFGCKINGFVTCVWHRFFVRIRDGSNNTKMKGIIKLPIRKSKLVVLKPIHLKKYALCNTNLSYCSQWGDKKRTERFEKWWLLEEIERGKDGGILQ